MAEIPTSDANQSANSENQTPESDLSLPTPTNVIQFSATTATTDFYDLLERYFATPKMIEDHARRQYIMEIARHRIRSQFTSHTE